MKFILLLCLCFTATAFAGKKVDIANDGEKPATAADVDPGSATPLVTQKSAKDLLPQKGNSDVKLRGFCSDAKGIMYQPGDAGYEACIGGGGDKARPAEDSTVSGSQSKPGIGITIEK